jgi:SAM-dependent methyltransferase
MGWRYDGEKEIEQKPYLEATTCWDYPAQSYGKTPKGDNKFNGVTPAFVIWNLIQRYTKPGDIVVDCMAGSGTTIDVAKEEGRRVIGYDIAPRRDAIIQNDARHLPLPENSVDLHFIDSPYSDNIQYSDHPDCIGKISCEDPRFFTELEKVAKELHRTLKHGKVLGWVIADQNKGGKFTPVGFKLYNILCKYFETVEIVAIVIHNQRSNTSSWKSKAIEYNFFLRGFRYLFIMRKPQP